jgi:ABC-2 type transport system ATP-binding protein
LDEKRKAWVVNLSGGQRQRLALGISLLNKPKILMLDEPTTGLDPNARREIWSILHKLKDDFQTSLILTTHYMEEAEHLCDYIVIIDHGKILKQGTIPELLGDIQDLPLKPVETRKITLDDLFISLTGRHLHD